MTEGLLQAGIGEIARRMPYKVACAGKTGTLRYAELDDAAGQVAARLAGLGIGRDDRVGLLLERGPDVAVAMLGVLRAGAAYLPLGATDPPFRRAAILADAQPRCVLVHGATAGLLSGDLPVIDLDDQGLNDQGLNGQGLDDQAGESGSAPGPGDATAAAYVVYTSGSTGAPKGVVVEHRNLIRHIAWLREQLPLAPGERLLQVAPCTFDAAMTDFFWPLSSGACVVSLSQGEHLDPRAITDALIRYDITALRLPPALLPPVLAEPALPRARNLRYLICGGDRLPAALARRVMRVLPWVRLFNRYGPTEAAVAVTYHEAGPADLEQPGDVPIGTPMGGADLHVDQDGQIVRLAPGCSGELVICGAPVARGYLGDGAQTARGFIDVPGAGRGYRTGDWVTADAAGTLRFTGRRDEQVQIAGHRVEPGEVRAALLAHPAVADCAVVVRPGREPALAAYIVPAALRPTRTALREFLLDRLPGYMVPSAMVWMGRLPATDRGKLDLAALPDPALPDPALPDPAGL
jgi:amino acid adenylation domain-containing protein